MCEHSVDVTKQLQRIIITVVSFAATLFDKAHSNESWHLLYKVSEHTIGLFVLCS